MNILVTMNDNYMVPLMIMLESLFGHTSKQRITVYLLYSDVSDANRRRLGSYIRKKGGRFIPIYVEETVFGDAPVFRYFTKEMYYRFLCSGLLPEHVDRVLYLDPDILIRGPVDSLYEMDFERKLLIGIEEKMPAEHKTFLGLEEKGIYVNSGVLLFNLKKMREVFQLQDFINVLDKNRHKISFPDQDVMNLYFRNEITIASRIYNFNTGYGSIRNMIFYFLGRREKVEPVIVHYMGEAKPWQADYFGKYAKEYFSFLKKYLSRKGRILFLFRPLWVMAKLARTAGGRILNKESGLYIGEKR